MLKIKKYKLKRYKKQLIWFLKSRFAKVNYTPIIVLGNQKSGTSAIAHLLADFGGLTKTIDIPPLWSSNTVKIMRRQRSLSDIVRLHRFFFSTELIKEPNMVFFLDQVLEIFPGAKYIFVVRDPRDNIRSILNRMKTPGSLKEIDSQRLKNLPGYRIMLDAGIWGIDDTVNYVGMLAHRWNKAVDHYVHYQNQIVLAKYEDFFINKYEFIRHLASRLGITEKADITDKLDIQYQPRGDRDVPWEVFFGMDNLALIEHICGSRMELFGYNVTVHCKDIEDAKKKR